MKHRFTAKVLGAFLVLLSTHPSYSQENDDTGGQSLEDMLNTQISAASKYTQTISQAPASVTIVSNEDIERYGYRTLEDVLMRVRGFYISNDLNYGYVGVRGFGRPADYNNRILLLLNGHTLNENVFGSAPIGTELAIDLASVERIEIVRGPGSALYGTGAMFAVVNVVTKKGAAIDGLSASVETGSFGRLAGSLTLGRETAGGIGMALSGVGAGIKGQDHYYSEYDDPSTGNGVAHNLDRDQFYGVGGTFSYKYFDFQCFRSFREKRVPTGAWGVVFDASPAKTMDQWNFAEMKYDRPVGSNTNIMARAWLDYYAYKGWFVYDQETYDAAYGNWAGAEAQFRWDIGSNNRLTLGGEYQDHQKASYKYWDRDTTYFDRNHPFHVLSIYLQDEYQVTENLAVTLGVRRDRYNTPSSSTSPRGAIVFNATKSGTLKLLYGQAFRKPNIYETFYEDPLSGYKANPSLKTENIETTELLWEQRLGKNLLGIISLYNYGMNDLIDQTIDPADSLVQFRNVSRARASGLELELDMHLETGLSGYINYIYQDARDTDLDTRLTNSPAHGLKFGTSYPVTDPLEASVDILYESERATIYSTTIDPYFLANLGFTFWPRKWLGQGRPGLFEGAEVSAQVRNLFDENYENPGGYEHRQDGIAQNGRNYLLKLKLEF